MDPLFGIWETLVNGIGLYGEPLYFKNHTGIYKMVRIEKYDVPN